MIFFKGEKRNVFEETNNCRARLTTILILVFCFLKIVLIYSFYLFPNLLSKFVFEIVAKFKTRKNLVKFASVYIQVKNKIKKKNTVVHSFYKLSF